ncbi:hypothetical protein KBD08_04030 [Candidatus Babeliales bacterium]|nr:hypothetical protein [Candidatus Babeliales bacterium]
MLVILHSVVPCYAVSCGSSNSTWLPRNLMTSSLYDLYEKTGLFNIKYDQDCQNFGITAFTSYQQSFGHRCDVSSSGLGAYPLWTGNNRIKIGNNDGRADLDAYQLGMGNVLVGADGIASTVQLNPTVQTVGTDFMFYYVHEKDEPGFYFSMHIPVGMMSVNPHMQEIGLAIPDGKVSFTQETQDPNSATIEYQFPDYPTPESRVKNIIEILSGGYLDCSRFDGNTLRTIRLRKARFSAYAQKIVGFGDISMALGYNFVMRSKGMFGVAPKLTIPTALPPGLDFILEPLLGRAGMWGVGIEMTGLYHVWDDKDTQRYLDIWAQAEVLHLMQGRRQSFRCFDLKGCGPGSKYNLLQNYASIYTTSPVAVQETIEAMVPFVLEPAANVTTLPVISKIPCEGSIAVLVDYHHKQWNGSLGCEFWCRAPEALTINVGTTINFRLPGLQHYAVIGRQVSNYRIDNQLDNVVTGYCQPDARINKSQDPVVLVGDPLVLPPGVTAPTLVPDGIKDGRIAINRLPSKFEDSLDLAGAQANTTYMGKMSAQIGHTWPDRFYMPSLSLISAVDWTHQDTVTLAQWSVGLKGAINF